MRNACWLGIVVVAVCAGAEAQTIYKCVGKDGKTAYSNSPCPGATEFGTGKAGVQLDVATMTQGQADLAADCTEVLFNASQPEWKERARETAAFSKYCPAFGFRAPLGPDTAAFNRSHGEQLIAKLRQQFADVPSTHRTYRNGYRSPPTFESADYVMKERPSPRKNAIDVSVLPTVQVGRWKIRSTRSGEREICGDPMEKIRHDLLSMRDADLLGCTVRVNAVGPRSVTVVTECPADRYESGRWAKKGKSEISIVSPSPQAVTIAVKPVDGSNETGEAIRLGDCRN